MALPFNLGGLGKSERSAGVGVALARSARAGLACLLTAVLAAGGLGCASGSKSGNETTSVRRSAAMTGTTASTAGITPVHDRLDIITGVRAVIPVNVGAGVDPKRPVIAKLDDGRAPATQLRRIEILPASDPGQWAPPTGSWRVLEAADEPRPGSASMWVLAVELPPDGLGQGLWVNGQRWELNWIASAEMLSAQHPELRWTSPLKPEARTSPGLAKLIEPDRTSPLRRWRYRLAVDGFASLTGRVASIVDATSSAVAFSDPLIESMANEMDQRWAAGLGRLRFTHADLARRLSMRLALVVEFSGDLGRRDGVPVYAPAWAVGSDQLDALLSDLLDPNLKADRRAKRAEAWLADRPTAVGWVIDDARAGDALAAASLSTVGIANLTDVSTLGWVSSERVTNTPSMTPIGSAMAKAITFNAERAVTATTAAAASWPVDFHAGAWQASGSITCAKLSVMPPGLTVGPLLADWTMTDWLGEGSAAASVGGEWATAAMLYKARPGERGTSPGAAASGWTLYVECRRPEGANEVGEFVRVWLGPTGRARLVVRLSPEDGEANSGAGVVREPGRWAFRVEIPEGCIEPDGTLRLGVERGDGRGIHSAWPRRMLPWQIEPGRLAVDTRAWSGLAADRE